MTKFFYVYILVSVANPSIHYTGIAVDLKERVAMHNRGKSANTSPNRPWLVETAIAFASKDKARAFEKYLKTVPDVSLLDVTSELPGSLRLPNDRDANC